MSVPTWKRSQSSVQFLYKTFELNKEIGRITTKVPKKYRTNYCDELIKEGLEAMKHLQIANDIVVNDKEYLLIKRTSHLTEAVGILDNILTLSYIFFEMIRGNGEVRNDWIDKTEELIGSYCDSIIRMTKKVIEKDKSRFLSMYGNKNK